MSDSADAEVRGSSKGLWVLAIVGLAGLLTLGRSIGLQDRIQELRGWIDGLGAAGPAAFVGVYIAAALALIPGSLITMAAGALFGVGLGTALVSVASTTAAALSFLLARGALRRRVEEAIESRPRLAAVEGAVRGGGAKIVGLLRLSPVVPFGIANYMFGLTGIRFAPYVLVSWVTMLPGTLLYVYLGHVGGSVAGGAERGTFEWVLLGLGLVATAAVTILLTRDARRRLAASTRLGEAEAQ